MTDSPGGQAAASSAIGSAASGAVKAGFELLDVVFKWIVPIILILVGFMVGSGIGLSGVLADLLDAILPKQVPDAAVAITADLVAVAIWGGVAAGLWSVQKTFDGKWAQYILRAIASLFVGFALSEIAPIFKSGVNYGSLSGMTQIVTAKATSK